MATRLSNHHKQQGVVLIVSLVFLIALTSVAAALMQNTTSDMKMSGASEERVTAIQETVSGIDEVIYEQVGPAKDNKFAQALVNFPEVIAELPKTKSQAEIEVPNNTFELEPDCPHFRKASSVQVFTCNVLRVKVQRNYGRPVSGHPQGTSTVEVQSGIAQQLLR